MDSPDETALLAIARSQNRVSLATASSGLATGLLSGGWTTHSRFKVPLQIHIGGICSLSRQSTLTEL